VRATDIQGNVNLKGDSEKKKEKEKKICTIDKKKKNRAKQCLFFPQDHKDEPSLYGYLRTQFSSRVFHHSERKKDKKLDSCLS